MLDSIKSRLKGKVAILGIGNTLRSDDGAGSILASRIKDKFGFVVFDAGASPENYLERLIREKPDTVVIIDTADFGGLPGEFKVLQPNEIKTVNLFFTHNASVSLTINYLQIHLKADIIVLIIQPKSLVLGENLSCEVAQAVDRLEDWFYEAAEEKR